MSSRQLVRTAALHFTSPLPPPETATIVVVQVRPHTRENTRALHPHTRESSVAQALGGRNTPRNHIRTHINIPHHSHAHDTCSCMRRRIHIAHPRNAQRANRIASSAPQHTTSHHHHHHIHHSTSHRKSSPPSLLPVANHRDDTYSLLSSAEGAMPLGVCAVPTIRAQCDV